MPALLSSSVPPRLMMDYSARFSPDCARLSRRQTRLFSFACIQFGEPMNLSIKYDFCGNAPLGIGFAQSHRKRGYHAEILNFPQGVGVDGRAVVSEKHKQYDALRRGFILANLNGTPTKGISFNEIIQMLRERKAGKPFFLRF